MPGEHGLRGGGVDLGVLNVGGVSEKEVKGVEDSDTKYVGWCFRVFQIRKSDPV